MSSKQDDYITSNIKYGTPIRYCPYEERNTKKYDYFTVVSWNVNMQAVSAYAPHNWNRENNKWELVYKQVSEQNPDIISFQEISIPFYGDSSIKQNYVHPLIQKYIDSDKWYITNSKRSHCGHTLILINKRIETEYGYNVCYDENIDPKNAAVILKKIPTATNTIIGDEQKKDQSRNSAKQLILFGVHLMYGDHGSQKRRGTFDRLYHLCEQLNMKDHFVIIGDTNMRDYDEANILKDYKGKVSSCWSILGDMKNTKKFMMTFYRNFFQIGKEGATRYDKMFTGNKIKCLSLGIFDTAVSKNCFHFLSDHRAICVDIRIE